MKILDRLILKEFLSAVLFALLTFSLLFIVVNAMENLDDFLDHHTPAGAIFHYYVVFLPDILRLLTPVAFLLASLFATGRMAARNEITAMKSAGLSLWRFLLPLLSISLVFSFAHLYFSGWIVPEANQKKAELAYQYLKKGKRRENLQNVFFRDTATTNVHFQYYHNGSNAGSEITIEIFDSPLHPRLRQRIAARNFYWDTLQHRWILLRGRIFRYNPAGWDLQIQPFDTLQAPLHITPEELQLLQASENELTLPELRRYIETLRKGGKNVRRQLIAYHARIAFSFANVVVVLFGVPFAFLPVRRKGIAVEIAIAMFAAFFYLAFTKISQSIVAATTLPPVIGGWLTNGIFAIAGIVNIIRVRS